MEAFGAPVRTSVAFFSWPLPPLTHPDGDQSQHRQAAQSNAGNKLRERAPRGGSGAGRAQLSELMNRCPASSNKKAQPTSRACISLLCDALVDGAGYGKLCSPDALFQFSSVIKCSCDTEDRQWTGNWSGVGADVQSITVGIINSPCPRISTWRKPQASKCLPRIC